MGHGRTLAVLQLLLILVGISELLPSYAMVLHLHSETGEVLVLG